MKAREDRRFVSAGRYVLNLDALALARVDEDAVTGEPSLLVVFKSSKRARIRGPEVGPLREFLVSHAFLAEPAPRVARADSGPGDVEPPGAG